MANGLHLIAGLGRQLVNRNRVHVTFHDHQHFVRKSDEPFDEVRSPIRRVLEHDDVPARGVEQWPADVKRPLEHENAISLLRISPLIAEPKVCVGVIAVRARRVGLAAHRHNGSVVVEVAEAVRELQSAVLANDGAVGTVQRRRHGSGGNHERLNDKGAKNERENQCHDDRFERLFDALLFVDGVLCCRGCGHGMLHHVAAPSRACSLSSAGP